MMRGLKEIMDLHKEHCKRHISTVLAVCVCVLAEECWSVHG